MNEFRPDLDDYMSNYKANEDSLRPLVVCSVKTILTPMSRYPGHIAS